MKSEVIETVVPEQIKKSLCYTCENCGAKYNRTSPFDECAVCGREICTKCKQLLFLVDNSGVRALCNSCYTKVIAGQEEYLNQVDNIANYFNSKLNQLNTEYLNSNL